MRRVSLFVSFLSQMTTTQAKVLPSNSMGVGWGRCDASFISRINDHEMPLSSSAETSIIVQGHGKMNDALAVKSGTYPHRQVEPVIIGFPKLYLALVLVFVPLFFAIVVLFMILDHGIFSWCFLVFCLCLISRKFVYVLTYEIRANDVEIQHTNVCTRSSIEIVHIRAVFVEHYEEKQRGQLLATPYVNVMLLHEDGTILSISQSGWMLRPFVTFLHEKFPFQVEEGYIPSQFYQSNFARLVKENPLGRSVDDLLAKP